MSLGPARGGGSWGRVTGLTSGGPLGFPEEVSYGAAKAAQVSYTMSAALGLAPYGVTANMVYPPPVTDTGWVMTRRSAKRGVQNRSKRAFGPGCGGVFRF